MSEFSDQGPLSGLTGASPAAGSAGSLIRRAREDAGVHIAALAVALKVPVKRLEALEADRYDLLPDAVFARALASSVCRSLKVDPARVLPLLPQSQVQAPTVEGRINEPFRPAEQAPRGWWPQVSRPALVAAVVLVAGALAVYLLPEFTASLSEPTTAQPAAVSTPPANDAAPPAAAEPGPATAPGSVVEPVPASSLPAPVPAAPAVAPPAPVPVPPPSPVTR